MKSLIAAALLVTACGSVSAGSLSESQLPADSQWYVHVNLDMMRQSVVGKRFMEEELDDAFDDIEDELGITLKKELDAVTVFGDVPKDGTSVAVVLHGDLSEDTQVGIQAVLEEKADSFIEVDYSGVTYFEVADSDEINIKSHHGYDSDALRLVFGEGQTMISPDENRIHQFIDGGTRLKRGSVVPDNALLVLHAEKALLQGGLNAKSADHNFGWDSSIMNNIEHVAGMVVEEGDGVRIEVRVLASSADTAAYVHNIIQGMVSLGALNAGDDPAAAELLQSLQIQSNENEVTLDVFVPASLIEEHVDF
ncbi:MAG: hypothetical protein QNJ40_26885 [Xanthomonadales bacterium]|nr:hypothetical protein [Xanthomonadales bacterium]